MNEGLLRIAKSQQHLFNVSIMLMVIFFLPPILFTRLHFYQQPSPNTITSFPCNEEGAVHSPQTPWACNSIFRYKQFLYRIANILLQVSFHEPHYTHTRATQTEVTWAWLSRPQPIFKRSVIPYHGTVNLFPLFMTQHSVTIPIWDLSYTVTLS